MLISRLERFGATIISYLQIVVLVSSPGIESLVPQSTDHPGYHHGVSIVQTRIALTTINLIRMVARTNLHHLFCCEHPENQNRHLQDFANRPPLLLPRILGEPLFQVFGHSVPGLNVCLPSYLTLEMCFERLTVVIFVEFDADGENGPVTARCEPGRLTGPVVKPFAHCRHLSTQIGCRHPDCDRAHIHSPSFVKRMPTPEDVH